MRSQRRNGLPPKTSALLTFHKMATQRQPNARHLLPTCSIPTRSPPPSDMPGQIPSIAVQDLPILEPGEDGAKQELQRESERQAWFQNESNVHLNIPNGYEKVAVLIIRWDDSIDEFKGHEEEVSVQ